MFTIKKAFQLLEMSTILDKVTKLPNEFLITTLVVLQTCYV